jgi:hypothetical protein
MPLILYITVMIAWGATGATKDSIGGKPFFSKDDCLSAAKAFSLKHKIKKEKCTPMFVNQYMSTLAGLKIDFITGEEWPIVGGYVCKKSKKGKLYKCYDLKDTTK